MVRGTFTVAALVCVGIGATWAGLIIPQYRAIALTVLALLALGWIFIHYRRGWRWRWTVLDYPLVVWLFILGISTAANPDAARRIVIGLWFAGFYFLLWCIAQDVIGNGGLTREALIDGLLLGCTPILISGLSDLIAWLPMQPGLPRISGTLNNPNPMGSAALILMFLSIGRMLTSGGRSRMLFAGYAAIAEILLIASLSRGAWIGAVGGLATGIMLLSPIRRSLLIGGISGLALLAITTVRGWALDGRAILWQTAITMFAEQPITGYGLYTFGRGLARLHGLIRLEAAHTHAHNIILNVAAELGVFGLIALAVTAFALSRGMQATWRTVPYQQRGLFAGAIAAIAGLAIHHLFDMTATLPTVAILGALTLSITVQPAATATRSTWRLAGMVGLIGLLLCGGLFDTASNNRYVEILDNFQETNNSSRAAEQVKVLSELDPLMPIYYLAATYYFDLASDPVSAMKSFSSFCQLEPDFTPILSEPDFPALHYFRAPFIVRRIFWSRYKCR